MADKLIKPDCLKRVIVIGSSGAGKTTLAKNLSDALNTTHIEMDAINWLPDWEQRSTEDLRRIVGTKVKTEEWVMDGNYSRSRDLTWSRATTIIWLDYSFPVVLYRMIKRTCMRVFRREVLFSGNRETFRNAFLSKDSMILWVLWTYHERRQKYRELAGEKRENYPDFLVFRNTKEATKFLTKVRREQT